MKSLWLVLFGSCMLEAAAAFVPLLQFRSSQATSSSSLSCGLRSPPTPSTTSSFSFSPSGSGSACTCSRHRTVVLQCAASSDNSEEVERRRQQYLRDRAKRERTLLAEGANVKGESVYDNKDPDVVPEYISRWGGADLAQEGPTRVTLELMNDSEWSQEGWEDVKG